ncbi:MAG: trypsin-like peptidase domain-containing protein [Bacteroidetes bacterium]|nr:trypsin-like peptidase domain-containing protein [Bacteroidota bacterium]
MKKSLSYLFVGVSAAITVLLAQQLFFKPHPTVSTERIEEPTFRTALAFDSSDSNFVEAAEKTVNAVVHVKNVSLDRSPQSLFDFFYGYESFQQPEIGTGSGVIISPDGHIVTNHHVIEKAQSLEVTLNNNQTFKAQIIGSDASSDIALLKIEANRQLPYLAFGDSDRSAIGEWVLAVGNPFNLTSTVTAGIISAKARSISPMNDMSFIQTDAAVNPGNSGGALVNTRGDLIGINTAIKSRTGSYVGYSFAVPSNIAKKVVEDLLEFGTVQKGILGITTLRSSSKEAIAQGLDQLEGVYVASVAKNSGAEKAGLQEGDIIRTVDGVAIKNFTGLTGHLSSRRPGDTVSVVIERNGELLDKNVVLSKNEIADLPYLGMRVENLSNAEKKELSIKGGVKIIAVAEYYRSYNLENKIIIAIDGIPINTIEDAEKLAESGRSSKRAITLLSENGEKETLIFN